MQDPRIATLRTTGASSQHDFDHVFSISERSIDSGRDTVRHFRRSSVRDEGRQRFRIRLEVDTLIGRVQSSRIGSCHPSGQMR
jgi:hypothetical protein